MRPDPSVADGAPAGHDRGLHDRVCAAVALMLRGAQARGLSDAMLEAATGISARTIKSYRTEGKEPALSNALALAAALGDWALNLLLAPVHYTARPLDGTDDLNVATLVADGLREFSTIASAAADGRIDHVEAVHCRAAADKIIATVLPLSSAGQTAEAC